MKKRRFYAFLYSQDMKTQGYYKGEPNKRTGLRSANGFLQVFTYKIDRDNWVKAGPHRIPADKPLARKLCAGMNEAEYASYVDQHEQPKISYRY